MSQPSSDRLRPTMAAMLLLAIVAAIGLSACGGGGSSSSSTSEAGESTEAAETTEAGESSETEEGSEAEGGLSEAEEAVEAARAVPSFTFAGEPVKASAAKGKSIFVIPALSQNEFTVAVDAQLKSLSSKLGVGFTEYSNQGSPTEWNTGIQRAISQKADLIVLSTGGDPSLMLPALRSAKAAGIPTILTHYFNAGDAPEPVEQVLAGQVTGPFNQAATLMANWALAELGEEAHPLIVTAKETAPSDGMQEAIEAGIEAGCPSCEISTVDVPVAEWATKMQSSVQSALLKDPNVNVILPLFDSMTPGVEAAITAAGKEGSITIGSFNGTPSIMKTIGEGTPLQMDVGESVNWIAYATMDQALRVLTGAEPIPPTDNNEELPLRVFDSSNVAEAGEPPVATKGYGDAYVAGYEGIWGLK